MKRLEYLNAVTECRFNTEAIKRVEDKYNLSLPDMVKCIISFSQGVVFFDNGYRTLSLDEIVNADKEIHVNFTEKQIIPLFDCGENDFIVYNYASLEWSKFNIIEECAFKSRKTISDLF